MTARGWTRSVRAAGPEPAQPTRSAGPKSAISPVRWRPPRATARARRSASTPPVEVTVYPIPGRAGEDVLIQADGQVLTGVDDGRILRMSADGHRHTQIAHTGGRPLGLEFHPDGGLVVCDAERGLLRVWPDQADGTGQVQELVSEIDGVRLKFCNNCAVAADGTIYFTDSSQHFGLSEWRADLLEHGGTGRLLRRDPNGAVTVLAAGLQFANGVALAADESFVVFAQTGAYSVDRIWLTGPRAGRREPFAPNLPAFPDNVSLGSDGLIWVALPSVRNRLLDLVSPRSPLIRKLVWALPAVLQPKEVHTVFVQAFDGAGRLVHDLQQARDDLYLCTGVRERDGVVWLGSLASSALGRIDL